MSLQDEIETFLEERRKLGFSSTYRSATSRTLEGLLSSLALAGRPAEAASVTKADLIAFLDAERLRGLSPGSVYQKLAILRVFFKWLVGRGRLLLDPARHIVSRPPPETLEYVPTQADIAKLLDACRGSGTRHLLLAALIELLYGSGLRLSEVRNLDLADVDLLDRTAFVRHGKGKKDRVVPITRAAAEAIARYVASVRRGSHPALFQSSGHRATLKRFADLFRDLVTKTGLPEDITPHRLRHACALHLLQNGASIRHIQRLLGHESILTTVRYLSLSAASLGPVFERAHPRESWRR